ncbi:WD40-repeat-containing domain protein, partial [Blyttiomyces helicus]
LVEDLDARIASIGDETLSFERAIRSLKGDSAALSDFEDRPEIPMNTCYKVLYGHRDSVESLDFDMPFGTLVTASADRSIRVWDLSSQRCHALLQGHTGWVRTIQIMDRTVISGSGDHTIRQWNLNRLPALPTVTNSTIPLAGHAGAVGTLKFDEVHVISGSVDRTVKIWDLRTGQAVETIQFSAGVNDLHHDMFKISVASGSKDVHVYNRSASSIRTLDGHTKSVRSLRHKDDTLISGGLDGVIRLWRI